MEKLQFRLRRRALQLSLETVAGRAGCTRSWLAEVERGISRPSQETAARIEAALSQLEAERFTTAGNE